MRRISVQGSDRTQARRGGRRRWLGGTAGLVVVAVAALLAAACSSGPSPAQIKASAKAKAAKAASEVKITPANGTKDADPSAGITVTAAKGTLKNVVVHTSGGAVTGHLSQGGKVWHSDWTLGTSQSYTVQATAAHTTDGTVTTSSTFRTLTPSHTFQTEIFEGSGQTYGVGMPIMLTFSEPVTNRAAVERSLRITASKPVTGAWYWDDSQHLDFRPQNYWPANTQVSFTGHLDGVEGASGMYATADLTQTFNIGASVIAVASTTAHRTQIYINGSLKYDWPISSGKASTATPNGTYLTIEKHNPVRMVGGGAKGSPGYYNELVPWSVRFTFSGDYYHDAPWSVSDQGSQNVSHGCVNLSPADAKTYYNLAVPGDPITITGSPKAGKWDDGWTEWFLPWSQFVKGSALHEVVQAGPAGSRFVSPSSVPSAAGSSPVDAPPPDNWQSA